MKCDRLATRLVDGGRLTTGELEHVLACETCRAEWWTAQTLGRLAPRPESASVPTRCVSAEEIASVLDGVRAPSDTRHVVEHVAACARCYERLLEMARDLEQIGTGLHEPPELLVERVVAAGAAPRSRAVRSVPRWVWAAAAVLGFALVGIGAWTMRPPGPVLLNDNQEVVLRGSHAELEAIEPRGEVSSATLRFEWRVTGPQLKNSTLRYRLLVRDLERGETLVEATTQDTFYVLGPEQVGLFLPGTRYHWLVEAEGAQVEPSATLAFWRTR